ncbi:6-phosphofructokinase [Candidatus Auribacterota bacterium]
MKEKRIKKIGILTGGGDCPGLNAVIRAAAKTAMSIYGMEVIGFKDGFQGLIDNDYKKLSFPDVSGILTQGGTILGTSNKADPFATAANKEGKLTLIDRSNICLKNYKQLKLEALICIGGDGTMAISSKLSKMGLNIVGVPKTIDNDLAETDFTFGFDSAVTTAAEAIDKLHSTAQSHHRVMIIEIMGRYAGWLTLYSGVASGSDIIIIPEIPYDINKICEVVKERNKRGKRFSIIAVAEGAKPKGGKMVVGKVIKDSPDPIRLGGIAQKIAHDIETFTELETRVTTLGHLQRGGTPTPHDRILATRYGKKATELVVKKSFSKMVALKRNNITAVSLQKAVDKLKLVPKNHPIIQVAKSVGTSFGV